MPGVLFIGPDEKAALAALRELASAHPTDMRWLVPRLGKKKVMAAHKARMTRQSVPLPVGYLVTFSIETGHPAGTSRHMSMSTASEGLLPHPDAVWMVAEELGFVGEQFRLCRVWMEDLDEGGKAVNVVQPLSIAPEVSA